ncbi:glycosyltransferase [Vibrio metschnikovii]|uniref:Glycosyltransferase n=1 Tax=bacterium 19CA03SA04 TaxID=2920698 RepID=A0AAU6SXW0_UNCXX|nr:glycosyltransferase [Vibrio sp. V31_P5A7T61]EKO3614754.1 glycosyltransferase [Vibrio metschnikovii]EKO3635528.1 glycosyltransferase [Vibrio metschnikovii]EKO3778106.1 glycosyltransferase [Vibrio metschnikovii]NAW61823.1 glycosyltransferase [Vibrio sp. V31_P5A7T61]
MVNNIINIICATYEAGVDLEKSLISIKKVQYDNLRVIIIDGGSQDCTKAIVEKYGALVDVFISEKDNGISDAFNKGLKHTFPGYVYFIGAGDVFIDLDAFAILTESACYKKDLLICGKVNVVCVETGEIFHTVPRSLYFEKESLLKKMSLPHQGLLTSTIYFDKYGYFKENCKYAMDYDILLRAYHHFPNVIIKDVIVANWMSGGIGANDTPGVLSEYYRIKKENKVASNIYLWIVYVKSLLAHYMRKYGKIIVGRHS